jgi:N-acetylglucosamine-6-phosphate deacetylase
MDNLRLSGVGGRPSGELMVAGGCFVEAFEEEAESVDCAGLNILPGMIDVHNHGAVGVDVNEADVDGLMKIAAFLATRGVTAWMPTLVPDSEENYLRVIDAIDDLMAVQEGKPVAQAVGVHYEGVFANEKMCGALRPEYFRSGQWAVGSGQNEMQKPAREQGRFANVGVENAPPATAGGTDPSAFGGLPKLKRGVHMTTLAPEIEGGIEVIQALVAEGWVVSIGHTRADAETLDRAYAAGARHMTHFFNAMTGIHHRDVGVAGWGLANEGVTFDIIADGIHVHPQMVALACRAKSPESVSLISDSVAPTGLGDGEFELWGETITVENGRTRNERGSIAGSVIAMDDAVRMMLSLGFPYDEVAKMASTNPARLLGLHGRGSLDVGKRADFVAIDIDGRIAFTVIGGEMIKVGDQVF